MTKMALVIVLALTLGACAAHSKKVVQSWVGAPEAELIAKLGPPNQVVETKGEKRVAYTSGARRALLGAAPIQTTSVVGGGAIVSGGATTSSTGGGPSMTVQSWCQTIFVIIGGKVASGSSRGNDCNRIEARSSK